MKTSVILLVFFLALCASVTCKKTRERYTSGETQSNNSSSNSRHRYSSREYVSSEDETEILPPYEYKGCSDQVGNYVLLMMNRKCDTALRTADKFDAFVKCKTSRGLNLRLAIEDCSEEILKEANPDIYLTVCPKNGGRYDKVSAFRQYHMNCCLVNHALQFSNKTWHESMRIDQACFRG